MSHPSSSLRNQFVSSRPGRALRAVIAFALLASAWAWSADNPKKALQIYFVDVEGGQATLFITPVHQSLLIDTGWPGKRTGCRPHCCNSKKGGDR